ncbi:MAG: NAD-dependent epimerase/dehydratase family protein [Cyclobacteriaceae bacterium]
MFNPLNNRNVLITGIGGFIGRNLVDYLHHFNWNVYGYSRNSEALETLYGDKVKAFLPVLDVSALAGNKIGAIIHLAGIAHDLSGNYREEDYTRVNYRFTQSIFDAFTKYALKYDKFIFLSSVKAVTDQGITMLDEEKEPDPVTPYGRSKRMAEEHINNSGSQVQKFILRPCMVHGPGNKGNLNLLFKFVKSGIPFPLGNFSNQRSLLTVDNLCFVIHEILMGNLAPSTYNVADSGTISTCEIVENMAQTMQKKSKIWNMPKVIVRTIAKTGDYVGGPLNSAKLHKLTEDLTVNNQKLLTALGKPLPVDLKTGLTTTLQSFV